MTIIMDIFYDYEQFNVFYWHFNVFTSFWGEKAGMVGILNTFFK